MMMEEGNLNLQTHSKILFQEQKQAWTHLLNPAVGYKIKHLQHPWERPLQATEYDTVGILTGDEIFTSSPSPVLLQDSRSTDTPNIQCASRKSLWPDKQTTLKLLISF